MSALSPALRTELVKLTLAQQLDLLGELVEPSIRTPFDTNGDQQDEWFDVLAPVTEAYVAAFRALQAVADPQPLSGWHDDAADRRYFERVTA